MFIIFIEKKVGSHFTRTKDMNVTQSQTLLGLLPQLKSMEDNIVSMIMELSTKLANLTDASVFVLVDVPNQRKFRLVLTHAIRKFRNIRYDRFVRIYDIQLVTFAFSGSQHLVDQYLNGGIAPVGNDIELQVSVEPAVVPKPTNLPNESRAHAFSSEIVALPTKRRTLDDGNCNQPKRSKNLLTDHAMNVNPSFKAEPHFESEVDLTLEEEEFYDENAGLNELYSPAQDVVPHFPRLSSNVPPPTTTTTLSLHSNAFRPTMSFHPTISFHPTNQMMVNIDDLNIPLQKIDFLKSVHDTEKLFVKGK